MVSISASCYRDVAAFMSTSSHTELTRKACLAIQYLELRRALLNPVAHERVVAFSTSLHTTQWLEAIVATKLLPGILAA